MKLNLFKRSKKSHKNQDNEDSKLIPNSHENSPETANSQIKLGDFEKEMFKDFNLLPNQNYRCGVKLNAGMTMFFKCSTDDNCNIINISLGMDYPFPELNFNSISEIKDENEDLVERVKESLYNSRALHEACAAGDVFEVRRLLNLGLDANSDNWESGFTPLHVCVAGTDCEERQFIIEAFHHAGADLNVKDSQLGLTPLHYAGMRNKPLCAQTLIEWGAIIDITEVNGATALHGAAFQGNFEVAEVLLEAGIDPNTPDNHNNTPLSLAKMRGHFELIDLMENYC
jgi:hypothetical protein